MCYIRTCSKHCEVLQVGLSTTGKCRPNTEQGLQVHCELQLSLHFSWHRQLLNWRNWTSKHGKNTWSILRNWCVWIVLTTSRHWMPKSWKGLIWQLESSQWDWLIGHNQESHWFASFHTRHDWIRGPNVWGSMLCAIETMWRRFRWSLIFFFL